MSESVCTICRMNNLNFKNIINVFFEGMGFTPICKGCTIHIIFKPKISCKRYAVSEREDGFLSPQCSSRASCCLSSKDGYLPCCQTCVYDEDTAVNHELKTHKYGEVKICDLYADYIGSLHPYEKAYMGLISLHPLGTYFFERHDKPELEDYYMDYREYHIPSDYYAEVQQDEDEEDEELSFPRDVC